MDANTAERISQLAKSLKELHLAASAEEAYERARQIIEGTAASGTDKSIKELMGETGVTQQELEKAKVLLKEEEQALRELTKELTELKAKQLEETMHHGGHVQETEKLDKELVEDEYELGVTEENVDVAEEVQDRDEQQ
jgi:hypothetical protein